MIVSFDDQVLMLLLKLRLNYTDIHLAALLSCNEGSVIKTLIAVFHQLLIKRLMSAVPNKDKHQSSTPASFMKSPHCRMKTDCTDIKVAALSQMSV